MINCSIFIKALSRILIPKSNFAEIVELEAKRKLGKLGGGDTVIREVKTVVGFLENYHHNYPVVLFDVGANKGLYSREFLKYFPNAQVVAFEPSSHAFLELKDKFMNFHNVKLQNLALSHREGEATLFYNEEGSGLASLTNRNMAHTGIAFDKSEIVNVTTGDEWIANNSIFPNFIKLDVEGHELDILKGFKENLDKIELIQFEFGGCNIDTRTFFFDFWELLSGDFKIYRITPYGVEQIRAYSENCESFMTSNFIAVHKS